MKIKPVALCAHGDYQAGFEDCFVDLGCLEKQIFQQRCWKTAESIKVCFSPRSHFRTGCHRHRSVEWFQSRTICSYDKTDSYYK